ncbi:fibronectin type III domain-containing protein, partial [Candidatus Calescamantes bacterium]|nr:fibronectin type III domain-containing protein [Candidatus Calescamantes bacterium]
GLTQLSSVTSFTINSSGNSYNATKVTVEGIGGSAQWGLGCDVGTEAYEGVLVTLYNVEVSSPLSNYGYWKIKDQGGTLELSCDDTFYLADIANGQTISQITGILSYGYDFYRLNPRSASDINTAAAGSCNDSDVTAPDWAVSGVSNITFTDSTATSVALSWDAATDSDQDTEPVKYDVYRHTATIADTSSATLISSEQTATTCSSTGLTAETQYFYKIVARNCVPLTQLASDELDITTPAAVVADGIYAVQFNNSVAGSGDDCYSSPDDGNPVTLTGVVMTDGFDKYFIADDVGAWNGIYVYDYTNKPAIGDEVTVTGTVDEYYGLTEIIDVTSYTNNGASTVYDSTTVTVEAIGGAGGEVACNATTESYEGVLVTFYDVVVSSATGNHGYWRIKDAAGTKEIEVDDMIYHADMPLGQALDQLTGFVSYSFDIYTINPRSADDIVLGCEGTDVTAPDWAVSGVSNIAATDPGSGARLDIDWDAATDAENVAVTYDLYSSTTSPVNIIVGNLIASDLTSTSYMNTGLTTGTTYYYKVLAKNCVPLATTSSDEATEVPTLDLTFTDICDIQAFNASDPNSPAYSLENGNSVWIKGIATVDQGVFGLSGSSIYVQTEGGCGVNVFSYEVMSISEGDTVICQGEVEEYRGTTEVKVSDTTTFTITPSGTTITPEAINTTLEENWQDIEAKEGQLVTFTGVVSYIDKTSNRNKLGVQDATETDSYGITVFWYDGTGDITWDAVADFTLGETVTVVGIVGQMDYDSPFTSYYQILVRK